MEARLSGLVPAAAAEGGPSFTPQLIPFTIAKNGPADVSDRFEVTERAAADGNVLEAQLHGRNLRGARAALPASAAGYVVEEKGEIAPDTEGGAPLKDYRATHAFGELVYWNHDDSPTTDDHVPKALEWFGVAARLAERVSDEAMAIAAQDAKEGAVAQHVA